MRKHTVPLLMICGLLGILLSGCGGGSGGSSGGSGTVDLAKFTKWSEVPNPGTVKIDGISQDAIYTAPAPSYNITAIEDKGVNTSSVTIKYGSDHLIEKLTIKTPFTDVSWDTASGDTINSDSAVVFAYNPAESNVALAANAIDPSFNWEYQTFGVWLTGRGTGSGTAGAMSAGAPTSGSAIPTVGNVSFSGLSLGMYTDLGGANDYSVVAPVVVDVDFLNRQLSFNTFSTEKVNNLTGSQSSASNLDMTGTLTYASATNTFKGNVNATGLSGTTTGRFYGPSAEELGGVFGLTGSGLETYSGAYGAKR